MTTKEQIQAILSQEDAVDKLYQIIYKLETKVTELELVSENINKKTMEELSKI